MKKLFSMMLLLAAVMVSAFTSCKSDDDPSAADKIAGTYTAEMVYAFKSKDIGSKKVSIQVIAADAKHVDIVIPEIKDLSFSAPFGNSSIDIVVEEYGSYTIKNVPVIAKEDVVLAGNITSEEQYQIGDYTTLFTKFPYTFKVNEVPYKMDVRGNKTDGKTVVSGEVIAMKVGNKFSIIYGFYPAESLVAMGISIVGVMNTK